MKYLRLFSNESDFETAKPTLEELWVALTEDVGKVHYTPTNVTITFKDYDGSIISSKTYSRNETIIIPEMGQGNWPEHTFIGWGDVVIDKATSNMTFIAQYEVTPKVTITMNDTYTDTASIALNATKTETVTGVLSFSTDLSNDIAEITDNVLTFKKHYEGSVTVTASALDVHSDIQSDSKTITVSCDGADTVECSISGVNTPEVGASTTSATVTYKCNVTTTTHAGVETTVTANKEQVVEFDANESEEARDIEGSFTCEHGETVNYIVKQEGKASSPYQAIDLGLSVNWSSCNLGATKPEEYGDYYMWASVTPNTDDVCDWAHAPYQTNASATSSTTTKWTKYLGSTSSSYKDPSATNEDALKTVLDPEDDAAYVATGGSMRMPTKEEFDELLSGTTNEWTTENGVYGRKLTSKTNSSKYIFIPASGNRNGSSSSSQGSSGYVRSSSLNSGNPRNTYSLNFYSGNCTIIDSYRNWGIPVRPVSE